MARGDCTETLTMLYAQALLRGACGTGQFAPRAARPGPSAPSTHVFPDRGGRGNSPPVVSLCASPPARRGAPADHRGALEYADWHLCLSVAHKRAPVLCVGGGPAVPHMRQRSAGDEHEPLLPEAVETQYSGAAQGKRDSRLRWLHSLLRDQQPGASLHDGSEASASAAHPSLLHRKVIDKKRCDHRNQSQRLGAGMRRGRAVGPLLCTHLQRTRIQRTCLQRCAARYAPHPLATPERNHSSVT